MQHLPFAELNSVSNFSFLHGASHPEEIVQTAASLGYQAIAICDHSTVAGIVRAFSAARELPVTFITAARLRVQTGPDTADTFPLLAHPISKKGYGNLCRMISHIKQLPDDQPRSLSLDLLARLSAEIAFTIIPPEFSPLETHTYRQSLVQNLGNIIDCIRERRLLSLLFSRRSIDQEKSRLEYTRELAHYFTIPRLASNDALYHTPDRRLLQDVLHCIKIKKSIEQAGFELQQNSERHLKSRAEIYRLFRHTPEAISRGLEIAAICSNFSLTQLRYEYPHEILPEEETPKSYLRKLTNRGAQLRFPEGIPERIAGILEQEFVLIEELGYEKYFLTCYDIVEFARSRDILCQGRGAAANSVVCYCLGITAVNPVDIDLLFARFISKERSEPPDIDIDFEHERREEVIQYIYQRYGRERAALVCEVVRYRQRSAIRDISKALGLSLDVTDRLAKSIHRWNRCELADSDLSEIGLNPRDSTIRNAIALSAQVQSFPRHLSQHVGGFIISETPLCELVPIMNARMEARTVIEWDKDDIEELGMLKIDILALGMLSCIRKAFELINQRRSKAQEPPLELHMIPGNDSSVYDMICDADTVGVFQIESRAQMSMLPRLRPRNYYDLVIEVAIVRPGPIQGNMVHPYLKRRSGEERVSYPNKKVEEILHKTLGVPLFQEQAMRLAVVMANFTPGEAEKLRRAMAAWKHNKEVIAGFTSRIIAGMTANGYSREYAETCVHQIRGFSEYGFPESHAASFALLVYISAWLKRHHPAEFAAALLNSQPMGFYAPSQIIRDAQMPTHGLRMPVTVLPIDARESRWDCSVEEHQGSSALRLGLRLIKGLPEEQGRALETLNSMSANYGSIQSLWLAARNGNYRIRKSTFLNLARADAFLPCFGVDRHQAIWQVQSLTESPLLREIVEEKHEQNLPQLSTQESMFRDYEETGFSLKAHPLQFLRTALSQRGVYTSRQLRELPVRRGRKSLVTVAGIAIVRQRPGTAKGVVFLTLEDETGVVNALVRPAIYEQFRSCIVSSSTLLIKGTFERASAVIYVHAQEIYSLDPLLKEAAPQVFPSKSYSY